MNKVCYTYKIDKRYENFNTNAYYFLLNNTLLYIENNDIFFSRQSIKLFKHIIKDRKLIYNGLIIIDESLIKEPISINSNFIIYRSWI